MPPSPIGKPRRAFRRSGTDGSNPVPSSGESVANSTKQHFSAGRKPRACAQGQKLPGYDPDVAKNRAEARNLMQKLGYGPDRRLPITVSTRNHQGSRTPARRSDSAQPPSASLVPVVKTGALLVQQPRSGREPRKLCSEGKLRRLNPWRVVYH